MVLFFTSICLDYSILYLLNVAVTKNTKLGKFFTKNIYRLSRTYLKAKLENLAGPTCPLGQVE